MTFQRNLGRVRGRKGGYYDITLEEVNANQWRFKYKWEDNPDEIEPNDFESNLINIPVYVPRWNGTKLDFDLITTNELQQTISGNDLQGTQGEQGEMVIKVEHIDDYHTKEEMELALQNGQLTFVPNSQTLYILTNSTENIKYIYVYHKENENDIGHFDSLDGVNLENYCTKQQIQEYVNSCFCDLAYYDRLALGLLDISYTTTEGIESVHEMNIDPEELAAVLESMSAWQEIFENTDNLADLLSEYAKKVDLYVKTPEEEEENDIIINVGKDE